MFPSVKPLRLSGENTRRVKKDGLANRGATRAVPNPFLDRTCAPAVRFRRRPRREWTPRRRVCEGVELGWNRRGGDRGRSDRSRGERLFAFTRVYSHSLSQGLASIHITTITRLNSSVSELFTTNF